LFVFFNSFLLMFEFQLIVPTAETYVETFGATSRLSGLLIGVNQMLLMYFVCGIHMASPSPHPPPYPPAPAPDASVGALGRALLSERMTRL
jgi:hypothetical protein